MSKARELSELGDKITVDGSGNSTFDGDVAAANLSTTGNITVTGTVDGRDVAADGTKLDGIEAGATADQTAAEIKTAYESNANTNAYTDAEKSKLDGIEAGADVTDTANVTAAGALMDSEVTNLAAVKAFDPTDYATAAQGSLADSALQSGDNISSLTNDAGYTTNVGDITGVTAGSGLTGGGTSGGVTLSHADTSTQESVNNTGNTFIQDVTLDGFGHVTGLASATVTSANDATITVAAGSGMTGGGAFTTNQSFNETVTLSHADTSAQGSVNNSNGTVIQDVTLDTYGHVTGLASVNLDSRYLPTSGGTINGNLDVNGLVTTDNFRIPTATSDPSSPAAGQIYYNTSTNYIRIYDNEGSEFRDVINMSETDPYWSDVTILLRDGQYTNYGIASNAANGSGTTTGASDKPTGSNGSFFIDNDWFYVPYNASFRNFNSTSGLTIEFYAKVTRTGGNHFMGRWSQNGGEYQFSLTTPNNTTFSLGWRQEGSQGDLFGVNNTLGLNAWHHYAFVVDVPNKKARTYYDGTLVNTVTHSGTALYSNSENWHIGYKADSGSVWSGAAYIEGLRVTNQARYTTSFTAPSLPVPTE